MTNSDPQQTAGHQTRNGLLLKEAREAKGLSLEAVHELTKIPLDVLHAIEDGYTVRMVSMYYFKGFIKMYAKYLGIDPVAVLGENQALAQKMNEEALQVEKEEAMESKYESFVKRQTKKQMILKMILVGAGILIFLILSLSFKKFTQSSGSSANPAVKVLAAHKSLTGARASEQRSGSQSKPHPKIEKQLPAVTLNNSNVQPSAGDKFNSEEQSTKHDAAQKVNLTVRARTTGWLQVKVDGNVVFQSTMHEGTAETWKAQRTIELSGKNINNLDFELNGKLLGQLGRSDRGARRVIVTSEGLSVKK